MKKLLIFAAAIFLAAGAFWAKDYYNDRYVVSDSYYTRIPEDETTGESWLTDADGVRQTKGKEYDLVGYNDEGEARTVRFSQAGEAEELYAPGTYIRVDMSKTLVVALKVVDETSVPQPALEKIIAQGTKPE